VLTDTYSASALAISGLMPCCDRSHDSIVLALLSHSALKIAHQPCVPRRLSRRLQTMVRVPQKRQQMFGASNMSSKEGMLA
jgi:hypothetical protein